MVRWQSIQLYQILLSSSCVNVFVLYLTIVILHNILSKMILPFSTCERSCHTCEGTSVLSPLWLGTRSPKHPIYQWYPSLNIFRYNFQPISLVFLSYPLFPCSLSLEISISILCSLSILVLLIYVPCFFSSGYATLFSKLHYFPHFSILVYYLFSGWFFTWGREETFI